MDGQLGGNYVGFVDDAGNAHIRGWAADTDHPERILVVEAVNVVTGHRTSAIADVFRADLKAEGFGDGCHAFLLDAPISRFEEEVHVRFVDDGKLLGNGRLCRDAARVLLTSELPVKFVAAMRKAAADVC